jgi:hypothetical protein
MFPANRGVTPMISGPMMGEGLCSCVRHTVRHEFATQEWQPLAEYGLNGLIDGK